MRIRSFAGQLGLLCLATACSEQEFNIQNNPPPAGDLSIRGRVCDPVTRAWVADALVYTHLYDKYDVVYESRSDYTDANGFYELSDLIADKDYELYTQVGHDIIDRRIVSLGGGDLDLPPPNCAGTVELDVAVITGAYDDLTPILDMIGVSGVRVIDGQASSEIVDFLTNPTAMAEYEMIFFDGGHKEDGVVYGAGPVQEIRESLLRYVSDGGVVFASDWAYDVIEHTWPTQIDFYGDDDVPDAAQVGEEGEVVAQVVDPSLSDRIGVTSIDITYDLAVWPLIQSVDDTVLVQLQGDAPWREGLLTGTFDDAPLLVSFGVGKGDVVFTTYRNAANVSDGALLGVLITIIDGLAEDH